MNINTENEVWKDVVGYEGYYQVSSFGRVKRVPRDITGKNGVTRHWKGKVLKHTFNPDGYPMCILSKDGKTNLFGVHRLVAQAFVSNPEQLPVVNHKDEDKTNNIVNNLEWCTVAYNNVYGERINSVKGSKGFKTRHQKHRKPVEKYTVDGQLIKRFNSLKEAYESSPDYSKSGIAHCCTGRLVTYKGFIWKYADEVTQ
ncbi:NUMOD4 domain-containing protein [Virgibacillus salarius]